MQLRTLLHKRIQVELELTKKKIRVLSQVLASTAKASLKRPLPDLDQKLLSTKIAPITFQTATVLTVSKVLTAAERMRT